MNRTRRPRLAIALTAAAALVGGATPAFAQDQAPPPLIDPEGVVENFNIPSITPVLRELGVPFRRQNQNGYDVLISDLGVSGVTAVFWPRVCGAERTSCAGLVMRAYYTGAASLELNNRFNLTTPPIAAMTDGSSVFVQRYLIGDYGVTRGSLAVNIQVFKNTALKFRETLTSAQTNVVTFGPLDPESDAPAKIDNVGGAPGATDDSDHGDIGDGVFLSRP